MYKPNPKPMELTRKSRLLRTAVELEKMLSHLRSRPLPAFPNHGRRAPELHLCKVLVELAAEARELTDAEAYSGVGEDELHLIVANFHAMAFAAKQEFFAHVRDLDERFKL
jgi:hypothetical protein